jgi:hypothetical protein
VALPGCDTNGRITSSAKRAERRAKLLGLDAPTTREVVMLDAIDAEIERLIAELGPTTS